MVVVVVCTDACICIIMYISIYVDMLHMHMTVGYPTIPSPTRRGGCKAEGRS